MSTIFVTRVSHGINFKSQKRNFENEKGSKLYKQHRKNGVILLAVRMRILNINIKPELSPHGGATLLPF